MADIRSQFLSLCGDIAAGTGLALINDWPILIANIVLILGRILLEWIIYKNKNQKKQS